MFSEPTVLILMGLAFLFWGIKVIKPFYYRKKYGNRKPMIQRV